MTRKTARLSVRAFAVRKWEAGNCICGICFAPLDFWAVGIEAATLDHVIPRRPQRMKKRRVQTARRIVAFQAAGHECGPATVYAHDLCNRKRGNTPPTGCQLIHLMVVNARLFDPNRKRGVIRNEPLAPSAKSA